LTCAADELVPSLVAQVVTFVPCLLLVWRVWPKHKDPWTLADTLVSLIIFPLLAGSAIVGSYKLSHDVELRWHSNVIESRFFIRLYMARAIFHCFLQCFEKMSWSHMLLMSLHHVISTVAYSEGLCTGNMHFFGCLAGVCEMSTIFLNNLYLSKELTFGGTELKEVMPKWLYAMNGVCLWLSFLVFRICLFPTWLYIMYVDAKAYPQEMWAKATAMEKYGYPCVTVFLFVLSSYWFIPITKGMLKHLGLIKSAPKTDRTSTSSPKTE